MIAYSLFKRAMRVLSESSEKPTYVSVKPDADSRDHILELIEVLDIPSSIAVSESELHATVVYSRTPIGNPSKTIREMLPIEATGDKLAFFKSGKENDKDCLVLKLSSVKLRAVHEAIKRQYGASHDFPTFEAHVTLCYDTPAAIRDRIEGNYSDPAIDINFTTFSVKELET